jgi:transposase InsO family protein
MRVHGLLLPRHAGGREDRRRSLSIWFAHYNELHPHRALGYRSPREFIAIKSTEKTVEPVSGL